MASAVDICNLALAHLGDEANVTSIDPPDQAPQAAYCAMFYPLSLASVLDEHNWGFATKTVILAQVNNPDSLWAYCYAQPSDFINVVAIYDYATSNDVNGFSDHGNQQDFSVESATDGSAVIYTNQSSAMLKYVANVANAAQFPPKFVDALAWKLAENLAGIILKGDVGVAAAMKCMQAYVPALERAIESDAQNRKAFVRPIPSGIAARA